MTLKAFRCTSLYYEGHNINRAIQILYFNGFLKQLTQFYEKTYQNQRLCRCDVRLLDPFTLLFKKKKHILSHQWHVSDNDQYEKANWNLPPSVYIKNIFTRALGQRDLIETPLGRADVWSIWCDGSVLSAEAEAADRVSARVCQHCLSARKPNLRLCLCHCSFYFNFFNVRENHCLSTEKNINAHQYCLNCTSFVAWDKPFTLFSIH